MTLKNCREDIINLIQSDLVKDLHIHSYYSDGELDPAALIDRWISEGFELVSITDHDVIEGTKIAAEYVKDKPIKLIPGIEFDSEDALGTKLHILGYGIDVDSKQLKDTLAVVQSWRDKRNDAMLVELANRGYQISKEEVMSINGGRFVGRPTFAKVLVNRGDFGSMDEAFRTLISKIDDEEAVKKRTLSSKEVVDTIHAASGIAVLAHPIEQRRRGESWEDFEPRLVEILDTFVSYGIDGIECYHPSASEKQSEYLVRYATAHNLLITRGSDFHSDSINRDYSRYHI